MSVANSPASAILRGRRLSSRRPSGRRASSSCDCCPSREPDEWTEWTTWVGQRRSAGLRSGVGRQSSKDVCVFLAPVAGSRASRTALHSSSEVARGGRGGRARAPLVRPPNRSSIEHRSNVDISAMFGRVRGAGKATASPRPPRRFDVVALRRLSGGNIRYRRGGCWGVPGCACAAGGSPSSSKSSPPPFSFHSDAIANGPDARDDSRGRLPPRGTDRRKLESSFQTKDAKQWPKKN